MESEADTVPEHPEPRPSRLGARFITLCHHTLGLIKFEHTIFALPFALGAMIVAARGWPGWRAFLLILAAMVTARSFAMAWNRLADQAIDARNPRTASRHLPAGILSRPYVAGFALLMALLFLWTCRAINPLAFALAPLALALLAAYSYTKRFLTWTHLALGLALGMAPVGAWIAVRGAIAWPPLILGLGVLCWVAGFDIIYATQDAAGDLAHGLHSVITRYGLARGLGIARGLHGLTAMALIAFGCAAHLGWPYFILISGMLGGLAYQHALVRPADLSRVNTAFFTVNGWISSAFLAAALFGTIG